jgi:hypothetical protein
MLATLPLNFLIKFETLYVVKPSLTMKAFKFLPSSTTTTITKYIENKTHFIKGIKELSQKLNVNLKELLSCTIESVRMEFAEEECAVS